MVQLLFICRKTNYFSKNYFTNFANYMTSLLLDMARESSKFIYKIRMTPLLFAVQKIQAFQKKSQSCGIKCGMALPYRHFFMKFKMVRYACTCCYNKHNCEKTVSIRPPPCGISAPQNVVYPSSGTQKRVRTLKLCTEMAYGVVNTM